MGCPAGKRFQHCLGRRVSPLSPLRIERTPTVWDRWVGIDVDPFPFRVPGISPGWRKLLNRGRLPYRAKLATLIFTPGPMVDDRLTRCMYVPLAPDGLARLMALTKAAMFSRI
jgi:hypothetical protein